VYELSKSLTTGNSGTAAGGTLHSVVMLHQQSEAQDLSRVHRNRALFADMMEWLERLNNPDSIGRDSTLGWHWYRDPSPEDEHTSCVIKVDDDVNLARNSCDPSRAALVVFLSAQASSLLH
jgi:hypothetical protein